MSASPNVIQELETNKKLSGEFSPLEILKHLKFNPNFLRNSHVQKENIPFLVNLLLILQDEIRPNSKIQIDLDLNKGIPNGSFVKKEKNYFLLWHKVILWTLILGPAIYIVSLSIVYQAIEILYAGFFLTLFGAMFSPLLVLFAAYFFGKSPKLTTRIYQVPKLKLKAQLADGTLLQTHITHWGMKRKVIKKKVKIKYFRLQKVKWKYKVRSVVHLQLSFPQKRYPMSQENFYQNFSDLNTRDKVKLKTGQKRNTVSYRYEETTTGNGTTFARIPKLKFQKFLDLMTQKGYGSMQKGSGKVPNEKSVQKPKSLKDLSGMSEDILQKLESQNIHNLQDLFEMDREQVMEFYQLSGIQPREIMNWQEEANTILSGSQEG